MKYAPATQAADSVAERMMKRDNRFRRLCPAIQGETIFLKHFQTSKDRLDGYHANRSCLIDHRGL